MTDDQLAAFVPDLVKWEGSVGWMYRDTLGYVTVGVGNLLHSVDDAVRLPFQSYSEAATTGEIGQDFLRVIGMPKGLSASAYAGAAGVHLTAAAISDLAVRRLRDEFIPGITRLLPGFESFPGPAQSALVDMAWNLGVHGLAQFSYMLGMCENRNWTRAAASCHRKTSRAERNDWAAGKFLEAAA